MIYRIYNIIIITCVGTLMLLMDSCADDHSREPSGPTVIKGLTVELTLGNGTAQGMSRAGVGNADDEWSKSAFTEGDVVGFYSSHGNERQDNGQGPFINIPMTFKGQAMFHNDTAKVSLSSMNQSEIFIYYPYTTQMPPLNAEEKTEYGLELRVNKDGNDTLRCRDILTPIDIHIDYFTQGSHVINGTMRHAFSEIIIVRGEGFDNPTDWDIKVVLNTGYSHFRVNAQNDPSWNCGPELLYKENYTVDGKAMSESDCREWHPWLGGNYAATVEEDDEGVPAWYVILPTLNTNRSMVDYIELYDNDGVLQKITSMKLSGNTKYLDPGQRYPIEISMNELGPTVNPYPIIPWDGDTDLTDERKNGVEDLTDFENWIRYYNEYLGGNTTNFNELYNFGDLLVDTVTKKQTWCFYILNSLDLSSYTGDFVIKEFKDILDGKGTVLSDHELQNNAISGLTIPFIGTITQDAIVRNIDFDNASIEMPENTEPVGIVANSVEGGIVDNCNVDHGSIVNRGPVGIITGELKDGVIRNCTVSGEIFGTASGSFFVVGTESGTTSIENILSSVIFGRVP